MTTTLADIPLKQLHSNGSNVRHHLTDIDELAASITEVGILQPLLVVKNDSGYEIIAGHRRRAAAEKVKLDKVPCLVADTVDQAEAILRMMAENVSRVDLSVAEQVAGFEQLALLGVNARVMSAATGYRPDQIEGARVAAKAESVAAAVDEVEQYTPVTFEHYAALGEFADDEDQTLVSEIAQAIIEGDFEHTLATVRQQRDDAVKRMELIVELDKEGIRLVSSYAHMMPSIDTPVKLAAIKAKPEHKTAINRNNHSGCPGHCAYLPRDADSRDELIWCCDKPVTFGHVSVHAAPDKPLTKVTAEDKAAAAVDEQAAATRRRTIACNKAMDRATEVRVEFARSLLTGKKAMKDSMLFITSALFAAQDVLTDFRAPFLDLAGIDEPKEKWRQLGFEIPSTDPARVSLLARLLACVVEGKWQRDDWRLEYRSTLRKVYLDFLVANGYKLADIEKACVLLGDGKKAASEKICDSIATAAKK